MRFLCIPVWKSSEGDGATQSIEYFLKSYSETNDQKAVESRYSRATFMEAARRLFITTLTLGAGGSGGLEGPTIPIGEAVGAGWSKVFKVASADDLRCFQMAGIAAAVCTLLNTPFAAAIFAAEVVYSQSCLPNASLFNDFSDLRLCIK